MNASRPAIIPRVAAVDVLRGLTMALMIVVNNPGSWGAMHPLLRHAAWGEPLRPADLVFPGFLFIMGASIPLALAPRLRAGTPRAHLMARAARRAAVLFAVGLGLNLFPDFDLATLRIPGVLQRIAVVFLVCAGVFLAGGPRLWVGLAAALLTGYTALLLLVPVPGAGGPLLTPEASWPVWLDERVLGGHSWRGPGDPEGILSTIPACTSALLGMVAGACLGAWGLTAGRVRRLGLAGLLLAGAGVLGSRWHPAAKELWTATYVGITGGASLVALAGAWWLTDRQGRRGPLPLLILGRHALAAFAVAHLVSDITIRVVRWPDGAGGSLSLHHWLQQGLLATGLPAPAASLAHSLVLLALIVGGLWLRERRRPQPPAA
jgi:predicted acyltransferase